MAARATERERGLSDEDGGNGADGGTAVAVEIALDVGRYDVAVVPCEAFPQFNAAGKHR